MKKIRLFLTTALLLISTTIFSQEETVEEEKKSEFTISGEARPRAEYLHGYKIPAIKDQSGLSFVSQRTRLNFNYSMPKVKFGLVLQDVRNWGDQPQLVTNEDFATSVHQAWGEVEFFKGFSLKAGRMELAYDDHRILGNVGWAQQGRSHDLALLKYEGVINVHLGAAFHGNRYQGNDAYRYMEFLWLNGKVFDGALTWSFLSLANGRAKKEFELDGTTIKKEKSVFSFTFGPRLVFKKSGFSAALNTFFQAGKNPGADWLTGTPETTDQKISAFNINIDLGYKPGDKIGTGLGFEILSGNDFTDLMNTDQNAFTPFYGTNHKFNGWMDYFYVGNHGGNVGLIDIYGKFNFNSDLFFAKLIPHFFMPAGKNTYTDADGTTQDYGYLGTEIDLWAGFNIVKKVASIQFGYSHMFPTKSLQALKGIAPDIELGASNWIWVMLVVKPQFFKFSK